ncbi:MAG TPA: DUF885 domain-containing protein [Gammaproteobacteria bacterium]|nr:DUF885 domain-containing protein [Gammaproteobacteria bacterium]
MNELRGIVPCLVAALLAASCSVQPPLEGEALEVARVTESKRLNVILEEYFEELLRLDPLLATSIGDSRYNDQLPNYLHPEYRERYRTMLERYRARVASLDRELLEGQDRLSYDVFMYDTAIALEGFAYPDHLLPVNQFASLPTFFAQLGSGRGIQPFRNAADYDAFLKRIEGFVVLVDQAIANMREGMRLGIVQPRSVMEKVLPQLKQLAAPEPEQSVFWGPIADMPATIAPAARERLVRAYRAAIRDRLTPAYAKLLAFIRDEYLPACRDTAGYGALPGGEAWYAFRVKASTTTDLTPEQIHATGLAEVARIRAEMEAVRTAVGFEGDLRAFFRHLATSDEFYFTRPEDLLQGYRELQGRINAALPQLFDIFPKTDYEVRAVEAFRAQSAAGASYQPGTPDGSRPGVFYVNTFNLRAQPKFGMETLSLHEASPGHHFQISIQQSLENLPRFRRFQGYTAYAEGWALYAESLGRELGLFTDPYQWYGRLSDEMLRAMRLVVDTGLHAKGWTREQAIAYMLDNSSMAESDVVAEVERYIVIPGQALGYKIGQLAISELRHEAEQTLGPAFDVKAFHRQVLADGALPLAVLRAKVRAWIAEQQAAAAGTVPIRG